MTDFRRELPSVEQLRDDPVIRAAHAGLPAATLIQASRRAVASARASRDQTPRDWPAEVSVQVARLTQPSLRSVINATGVILHTNLGRAPLAAAARAAASAAGDGYATLEYDLHSGVRGDRADHGRQELMALTGAGDAHVVNNAAAALLLALHTVARGRAVAISRGELIEIGGSFRIPEILEASGATLMEIGTTNRTTQADYERAAAAGAGAFLVVHRSNFTLEGFVQSVSPADVASIARDHDLSCIYDQGTGLLDVDVFAGIDGGSDLSREPTLRTAVATGADVIVASGDKLLGGPQAGLMLGNEDVIRRCRRQPLARALRPDKMTLAALQATLRLYLDGGAANTVPVLAMMSASLEQLRARATRAVALIGQPDVRIVSTEAMVGGGTLPAARLPSVALALDAPDEGPDALMLRLRLSDPPVIARIHDGRVLLDVRTMFEADLEPLALAVRAARAPA